MDDTTKEQLRESWDDFANAGYTYIDDGERRIVTELRRDRHERLEIRRKIIDDFLEGRTDVDTFRSHMATECGEHKRWGFAGFGGMMFFNMLVTASEGGDHDLAPVLRDVLPTPENHEEATAKIEQLIEYIADLEAAATEENTPAPGHIPYFISYFWQLDAPDTYPIYYTSMREAFRELGVWEPSGDLAADYLTFWDLNEEIRTLLESHAEKDIHLWDIERLCLYFLNPVDHDPNVWVEKARPTEWNYAEPGSGLAYGEALWTPQRSEDGRRVFETLREPDPGDIVLHLSIEADAIVGVSTVASGLITDFDIPDDVEWTDEQREQGGYLRELADFRELDVPFEVRSGLLDVTELHPELEKIAADHSIFYTDTFQLASQAYLTRAPKGLVNIIAAQSTAIETELKTRGYGPIGPGPDPENSHFWITANPDIWSVENIAQGGEVFYTAVNPDGDRRRIVSAFEAASSGDCVVFYESTPVNAVIAVGTIVEGLHTESHEAHDDPVEGVTIQYERAVDPISWERLTSVEELESASPIINNAQGSLFHLTAEEFDAILSLEDPDRRYFWVNAAEDYWDGPGDQFSYSATQDRRNSDAFQRARTGDRLLVYRNDPVQQIVGKAHIVSGLNQNHSEGGSGNGKIVIEWDESIEGAAWTTVKRDSKLDDDLVTAFDTYVLTELTEQQYERILELGDRTTYSDYTDSLAVAEGDITAGDDGLHFPADDWKRVKTRVEQALADGNHVLLFGPPGTGKTKLARNVCEATVGDEFELVTASADWSTFDTVGGYQTTSENQLAFQPGVILDRFHADDEGTPANEWLIIDELNRADIDKAFGSLFSALTGESVTLPFDGSDGDPIELLDASRTEAAVSQDRFYIPEDWRMLATMNTLDKTSLYEMSYAFMRRWAFIPVGIPTLPDPETDPNGLADLIATYVAVWESPERAAETEAVHEPIGRIWHTVNQHRDIGPAIVEDIYEYVAGTAANSEPDYVSPLIMYVFPQLEGLRKAEIEEVLRGLDTIVDDSPDLWRTANDFFQMDLQRTGNT